MTDQGYLTEGNVVWEHLDRVDGDTAMCQHDFQVYVASAETAAPEPTAHHDPYQGVGQTGEICYGGRGEQAGNVTRVLMPCGGIRGIRACE